MIKAKKKKKVRLNLRISEEKMSLLIKKANKYFEGNVSIAAREAIDLFLIKK